MVLEALNKNTKTLRIAGILLEIRNIATSERGRNKLHLSEFQ
jgi:hypothetical protein